MNLFDNKKKMAVSGLIFGAFAVILAVSGNPKNMAVCVACFIRDIAGSVGMHQAAAVQYFRPEIVGFVLGAFIISLVTKEFKATGGSSPAIRFILGVCIMIGALAFLGCPLRMVIRMSAGDLNAYVGFLGFAAGIGAGCFFLKRGFTLGRAVEVNKSNGFVLPVLLVFLFVLSLVTNLFASSTQGPGSMHAPIIIALAVSIVLGVLAHENRICFAGAIRDIFIMKDASLLCIIGGFFAVMLIYNVAAGSFHLGFFGQPVSHSDHVWNFLGMLTVGLAATLAGGCPYRQLILAGQGSADSAVTFLGMLVGAAFSHNFGLAGTAAKAATETEAAVKGGVSAGGRAAVIICIITLIIIGFTNNRKITASK